jgi:hypothetical protein
MTSKFPVLALLVIVCLTPQAQEAELPIAQLDRLAARAIEIVDVTLNQNSAQFVAKLATLGSVDREKLREAAAKLKGVRVRGFEFAEAGAYSETDLAPLRAQLNTAAWQRIVSVRGRSGASDEVFIMPRGETITGWAYISAEPKSLCVINLVGALSLDEIALLDKHFGLSQCGKHGERRSRRRSR